MNENIIVPPPPLHPLLADRNRGRGRPDSNNRKKTLIRVFFVEVFSQLYFLRFKMVETFIGGGGGGRADATFYYYYYFFFFLGGGGLGGCKSLFL